MLIQNVSFISIFLISHSVFKDIIKIVADTQNKMESVLVCGDYENDIFNETVITDGK